MADPAAPSYVVLARRYRPQLFEEVVGQDAVVRQLHNEIQEGRIGHGYLFCGPRGTGKTSMARIFAKALNCERGPTTQPCGKCHHCQEIAAGTHLDVIEVDAATYTKAEETRELLRAIERSPFSARYKVYIIDEVHMLSMHSFNALLKSLEEPPDHVVFVLATTNPEKIPETVVSRCRRCSFDRIGIEEITRNLARIVEQEGVSVAGEERHAILSAIALASDGGLRDAQVLLDQVISLSPGEVSLEDVRSLLGVVDSDLFVRLLTGLADRDTKACLMLVADLVDKGRDLQRFTKMFLSFLRDAMLLKAGGDADLLRVAEAQEEALNAALAKVSLPFLLNIVQQFLDLEERMRGAAPPRFLMEFVIIKLTGIDPRLVIDPSFAGGGGADGTGRKDRGASASSSPSGGPRASLQSAPLAADSRPGTSTLLSDSAAEALVSDPGEPIRTIHTTDGDRWRAFVDRLDQSSPQVGSVLRHARLREVSESKIDIELAAMDRAMARLIERVDNFELIRRTAREVWRRSLIPRFRVQEKEAEQASPDMEEVSPFALVEHDSQDEEDSHEAMTPGQPVQVEKQPPLSQPMSLEEAFEAFPEFKEVCSMVERTLGVKPVARTASRERA